MQSGKVSKKTRKESADTTTAAAASHSVKPRTSRSATPKSLANEVAPVQVLEPVRHDDIAALAHSIWASRGYQHGSAEQDWLHAEQQLKSARASA